MFVAHRVSSANCTPYRHRLQGEAFDSQDYAHIVTTRYASVRTSGFITSTTSLSNAVLPNPTTTILGQADECLKALESIVATICLGRPYCHPDPSTHILSPSENVNPPSSSLSTACKKLRLLGLAETRTTSSQGTPSRRTAVRSLQKTNLAAEMNMSEMHPTMVLGVDMGMSSLHDRNRLRGLPDMIEAADMKDWTIACVIVRMRGGVADMVKTGGILAGHEETVVPNGDEALFANRLPHVGIFLLSE